jgi:hypothetical protein
MALEKDELSEKRTLTLDDALLSERNMLEQWPTQVQTSPIVPVFFLSVGTFFSFASTNDHNSSTSIRLQLRLTRTQS